MIEVKFNHGGDPDKMWKMMDWCRQQFGQRAPSMDNIGDAFVWWCHLRSYDTSFYFANERDYTWFMLRWS